MPTADIASAAMPAAATRVLILGAMPAELAACRARLRRGRWRDAQVRLSLTGVGKPAAAATTARAISVFRPHALIFTGVAGALDPRRRIGDLGIGLAAIDADLDLSRLVPGKPRGEQPFSRERIYPSHPALVAAALALAPPRSFPAYIASGSSFLDASGKAAFIRDTRPLLAAAVAGRHRLPDLIEMEGSAVLQAAALLGVPALALRAVSDEVSGDAAADFTAFLDQAAARSVELIDRLLGEGAVSALRR
jgi:adenosylhomocysteine nucleosidase